MCRLPRKLWNGLTVQQKMLGKVWGVARPRGTSKPWVLRKKNTAPQSVATTHVYFCNSLFSLRYIYQFNYIFL